MRRIWWKLATGVALIGVVLALSTTTQPADAAVRCPFVLFKACVLTPAGARESVATNACLARARHLTILHAGNCQGPFCNLTWAPVCARDRFTKLPRTFSNLCWAEVNDAVFLYNGPCK